MTEITWVITSKQTLDGKYWHPDKIYTSNIETRSAMSFGRKSNCFINQMRNTGVRSKGFTSVPKRWFQTSRPQTGKAKTKKK
jgi:hypothetical protein